MRAYGVLLLFIGGVMIGVATDWYVPIALAMVIIGFDTITNKGSNQ